MDAFHALAERSRPLIAAIRAYEVQRGRPPDALADLVPAFLPAIPATGMNGHNRYEYEVTGRVDLYESNPWVLRIRCGGPGFNFDQFLFFPRGNYPKRGFGGVLERVGEWAYVHE